MPMIIALNPRPKAKGKKMAKKKKRKMTALQLKYFGKGRKNRPMSAKQKKYFGKGRKKGAPQMAGKKTAIKKRKNPSPKKAAKKAYRYTSNTIGGININSAFKAAVPMLLGALVAKAVAKKFADGGAESDAWTWKNNALALAGGFAAAFVTSAILKKRPAANNVFKGALLLVGYKIATTYLAPKNASLEAWFGADDEIDPYAGVGGDMYPGNDGETYVQGTDGNWRPASESHRVPRGMSDVMVDPDPRYGMADIMVDPQSRYGAIDDNLHKMIENDGM